MDQSKSSPTVSRSAPQSSAKSTESTPNSSSCLNTPHLQPRRSFLSALFSRRDSETQNFFNSEGSINQNAWQELGTKSSLKVRLKAMEQLETIVRSRRLQFDTVEALFHETKDLLDNEEAKAVALKTFITLTECQIDQLGLSMRDTFFQIIRKLDLSETSFEWLYSLTLNGERVMGFEYEIMDLLLSWLHITLSPNEGDHSLAIRVLQFTQNTIKSNAGFLWEGPLDKVVCVICCRICFKVDQIAHECLLLLETLLKYGRIPDSELPTITKVLCLIAMDKKLNQTVWGLMRDLLRSHSGHSILKILIGMVSMGRKYPKQSVMVGAVYFIHMALWSRQRLDSLRCHASVVLPALSNAMEVGVPVMMEVLLSIKRLLTANGKDLQQLSWHYLLQLLSNATKLCSEDASFTQDKIVSKHVHQLISIIENLHRDGDYSGSADALFTMIENCANQRPVESIMALIDYRFSCIDPLSPNWLSSMRNLVENYYDERNTSAVREKAISMLHTVYIKHHWLHEKSVVQQFVHPILKKCVDERDSKIQYQMLNVLFDVAKTVSIRLIDEDDYFLMLMDVAHSLLELDINSEVTLENLEITVGGVCEVLSERFSELNILQLQCIVHALCEHACTHYRNTLVREVGAEIRERIFAALLSIVCDPFTGHLVKIDETGEIKNINIAVLDSDSSKEFCGEFDWREIAETVTIACQNELWFPALKIILQRLCRVFEIRRFVFSAGKQIMEEMKNSIIELVERQNELLSGDVDMHLSNLKRNEVDLAKYVCPVLVRLINYYRDKNICKILVSCVPSVPSGCQQAIMACDLAVQILPECMAPLARQLMFYLAALPPSAVIAIPILELASDSTSVKEFYQFFEFKHFKFVIDMLAPYTNVHRFNTFIVVAAFRSLMRWFTKVPEPMRPSMCICILEKIEQELNTYGPCANKLERRLSEERSSSSFDHSPMVLMGSLKRRSAASGAEDAAIRDKLAEETISTLQAFMQYPNVCDMMTSQSTPFNALIERNSQHWLINDLIISITTFTECDPPKASNPARWSDGFRVMKDSVQEESPLEASSSDTVVDGRRRHQSAIQPSGTKQVRTRRAALDDSFAVLRSEPKISKFPVVNWSQIVIRHTFGKHSWYLRSLTDVQKDFGTADDQDDGLSVLKLLAIESRAVQMIGEKNKTLRSLRNIDRISPLELHTVGIVYISHGQTKETEILANIYGSSRYSNFIRLLGDAVPLHNCPGGLSDGTNGVFTYVSYDEISKIVFHVATLMPNNSNDPLCNEKKKFIGNDFISVIFNESGLPYVLGTISGKFAYVALEVVPQDDEHMLVAVHARNEIALWLAISRAFLPDRQAAIFIRRLIVWAQLSVNVWRREVEEKGPPYIGMAVERLRAIRALASNVSGMQSIA